MKPTQLKQDLIKGAFSRTIAIASLLLLGTATSQLAVAQSIEDVRWKSESQVRAAYGEPESVSSPVGTHASYTMWKYPDFTVAFANNRAFHLFKKDSLRKFELEENRNDS